METFNFEKKEEYSNIEFDPNLSGIGVIATKPLDHSEEIEIFLDEIFSCEENEEQEEAYLSQFMGRKNKDEDREEYLRIIREGDLLLKLKNVDQEKQNLFWRLQYEKHSSEHFYNDLINSVEGEFVAYFVFYRNIPQTEVNNLFTLLKGRTPYYTEIKGQRCYNTEGYGIRGLYPRPSTIIQEKICEEILGKKHNENPLLYYNLEPEEQNLVYSHLNEMERFRILSNTVHTPSYLDATTFFINMLYREHFDSSDAKNCDEKLLIKKLIDLNKKLYK